MATYLNDDAICLRVTDFSETSQIVALLTREHGLLPLIAKGSKRQTKKSSKSGPLDLLTRGEVAFIPAKRGEAEAAGGEAMEEPPAAVPVVNPVPDHLVGSGSA